MTTPEIQALEHRIAILKQQQAQTLQAVQPTPWANPYTATIAAPTLPPVAPVQQNQQAQQVQANTQQQQQSLQHMPQDQNQFMAMAGMMYAGATFFSLLNKHGKTSIGADKIGSLMTLWSHAPHVVDGWLASGDGQSMFAMIFDSFKKYAESEHIDVIAKLQVKKPGQ